MVSPARRSTSRSRREPIQGRAHQCSLGFDFLHGKSTYSLGYVNSDESDYQAKTMFVRRQPRHVRRPDHDLAGLLARQGRRVPQRDTITDQIDPTFKEPIDRWSYSVGVSQILTKNLIIAR